MKLNEHLFSAALEARKNAYTPYSKFKVGAALLAENDKIYIGANVENISYPCGTCAETGAIANMIAGGGKMIKSILIVADSFPLIVPCGACLQRIAEFSDNDTIIHLADLKGIQKSYTLSQMLPLVFDQKDLRK